jgi:hypothetical protein
MCFVGVQIKTSVMFYYDEEPCLTLIGYGMWPATPKEPKVAFEIHLIEVAEVLFLECRLSTKQFYNALKWLCPDLSQAYEVTITKITKVVTKNVKFLLVCLHVWVCLIYGR